MQTWFAFFIASFLSFILSGCLTKNISFPAPAPVPPTASTPSPQSSNDPNPLPFFPRSKLGNGEAYNGPILSGTSIPLSPRRNLMTTQDIEGTLTLCYQQLIQSLLARFFRGDYRIDFARSCMHASTVQSPTDRSSFATLLEGHFQVFNRAGEEFRMHWGATVGKLVPQRKPPSSPALWIKIAAGNDSTLDDDDAAMWNKMKFLDLNFNRALPQYIFSLEDPEDLNNKLFVKEGVLAAAISNDVKIEHFSDGFFNAHFTEHGTKKSVTLALGELSQCLQFGLANQIEARLQQGELRDGR